MNALVAGFFVALFLAAPAAAATVNLFGANDDLGLVSIGQTGFIDNRIVSTTPPTTGTYEGVGTGFLPANSEITFTYTFLHGWGNHGILASEAWYNETKGALEYSAYTSTYNGNNSTVLDTSTNTITNVSSPILALANISADEKHGTTTIINTSDVAVAFSSFFGLYIEAIGELGHKNQIFATYEVSSVPLPDALPMFGAAMMGLMGFAMLRKTGLKARSTR